MLYVFIMQGTSGSGKSTVANKMARTFDAVRCSTDDLRYEGGRYVFRPEHTTKHHQTNQERAGAVLRGGRSVIIDNTNIRAWEARPYVEMAMEVRAQVVFVRCCGRFENVHGVLPERVQQMYEQMEELTVAKCLMAKYPWEK